ncbi:hypothetical protein [Micromonospora sp. MP36]|uniref:hypothetical protein n=1 Tax=Micromonospora sp. MP36 TaxID=2604468 RepID=UPI0016524590|nr:hypothetical protein [Micromonospora sp. MP36]
MSGRHRRWVWPALLIWLVGIVGVLGYLFQAKDRSLAGTVIQAVTAVLALAVPVTLWLWRARTARAPAADGLDRAADALAAAVRAEWETQARDRLLRYPAPVPVRWRWSTLPVTGSVADAVSSASGLGFAPLPGLPRVTSVDLDEGGLADLLGVYGGVDSGRLLVIGAPGAGKSGAAVLLTLDALAHRFELADEQRRRTPVPVLFTPHGWDPATQPVEDWLAGRLGTLYPFLNAAEYGPDAAAALVRHGRVALFLDGLDELPEAVRPVALRALDEQVTAMRLVVTTRSREMVDAAAERHLHRAAAVQLQPVPPKQAAAYLARCRVHPAPAAWQRLVEHVRDCPDSVVTQALDTPLMLGLVRDTLSDGEQVDVLLDTSRFTGRDQVEDELLDRVLPAAYATRPGQPPSRYTVVQAQQWLGYLADRMRQDGMRDLAWWQIPTWAPAFPRVITTMLMFGLAGVVFGLAQGLSVGLAGGLAIGLVMGLVVALVCARGGGEPEQLGSVRWSSLGARRYLWDCLLGGLTSGLAFGVMAWLFGGLVFGLVVGLVSGLAIGLTTVLVFAISRSSVEPGSPIDPITCWRRARQHGFGLGLVLGLGFGSVFAFVSGLVFGLRIGLADGLLFGLAFGLAAGVSYSETWPAGLAFLQLRRSGVVPVRLMSFLEDARPRHVLRTAGPVYQFRHARLQDRLATWYGGTAGTPGPAPVPSSRTPSSQPSRSGPALGPP